MMVIVSVNVFENITIEKHSSRRFQQYIILFCSSEIRWFRSSHVQATVGKYEWENEKVST